jgi:hypothetical protein
VEYDNPAALYYGARFAASNRRELAELLAMTEGSKVMADLQQFGLRRKLRYAHLQRSSLKRRLTSLRMT